MMVQQLLQMTRIACKDKHVRKAAAQLFEEAGIALDDYKLFCADARSKQCARYRARAGTQFDDVFMRPDGKFGSDRAAQAVATCHRNPDFLGIGKPAQEKKPPLPGKHGAY